MFHTNPSNEEITEFPETPLTEIAQIVSRARKSNWAKRTLAERTALLRGHVDALRKRAHEIPRAITLDMGKPLSAAEAEFERTIASAEYLLSHAEEWLAPEPRECGMLYYDPIGLSFAITPWNAPLVIPMFQILPSLLAGNPVVWKPSEFTPRVSELYFETLNELLPPDVLAIVRGGREHGASLVEEPAELITFTGSTATGRTIAEKAARNFTRLQFELGGVDAALVLGDAQIEETAKAIVRINATNSGQICCSIKRVLVEKSVAAAFVEAATEASRAISVGDPFEPSHQMGPLASRMQLEKCEFYLNDAIQLGARVCSGGKRLSMPGFYFQHTVLAELHYSSKLLAEEAFSPILPILVVDSAEEAVAIANSLPYALTASVWGQDLERMQQIASRLEGGVVGLNRHGVPPVGCPWGGARQSGIGRGRSIEGMRECCNLKFVY